jgi:hypothetical protein
MSSNTEAGVPILDENPRREGGSAAGVPVRLTDGRTWVLAARDPGRAEPEYDALLDAVFEAEDRSEVLRAELALTVYLLDRDHGLAPGRLTALLSFPAGDPALAGLQEAVHGLVMESARRLRTYQVGESGAGYPRAHRPAGPLGILSFGLLRSG